MNRLDSLLLVTDLSDAARPALQRAAQLAAGQQAGLIVLTAGAGGPPTPWRGAPSMSWSNSLAVQRTRRLLHRLAREVRGHCELRLMADVREGDALVQIARAAGLND